MIFAIGIHIVQLKKRYLENNQPETYVAAKVGVPNSADEPEIDEFLTLEAADNYLPTVLNGTKCVTANVTNINGA